jgi:hypothetical protein
MTPNDMPIGKFFIAFLIIVLVLLLLTGCASTPVPVKRTFPAVPQELTVLCPDLKSTAPDTTKLTDVMAVVVDNYALYHECSGKVELWNEWYRQQREIFDSVK